MKKALIVLMMATLAFFGASCAKKADAKSGAKLTKETIKVGFVYIGTINDEGYTQAHDQGRLALNEMGIKTAYIEGVAENADVFVRVTAYAPRYVRLVGAVYRKIEISPFGRPNLLTVFAEAGEVWAIHMLAGTAQINDGSGQGEHIARGDTALLRADSQRRRAALEGAGEALVIRIAQGDAAAL